MFKAALWSRSRTNPQWGHACVHSSKGFGTTAPHPLQCWLVMRGLTNTTRRPALAALAMQKDWNWPQPASKIDWFKPALAAAPLGRYCPAWSGSGLGSGVAVRFRIESLPVISSAIKPL
jgi:hypothetical protein